MTRPGIVVRTALLDRLAAARSVPIIAVVAPAGYGKSMLLAQWAKRRHPRSAWVSCDDGDNDPAVLLSSLAAALARVHPVDPTVFRTLTAGAGVTAIPGLLAAITPAQAGVALVLDHVEAITTRDCHDILTELALRLPPGWQLAMASRQKLPFPVARLRVQGSFEEIGAQDLAMGPDEAALLLEGTGLRLTNASVPDLVDRTEGWPIGLYLTGLALKAGHRSRETVSASAESSRFLSGYLKSEFVDRTSSTEMSFLTRTSVLDRMCGALCDATLGIAGSTNVIEQMESRNLLVVPLDDRRQWYRYHHLFRQLLHEELRRREPDLIPHLHGRAAAWLEANGMPEDAIAHARAAGDTDHLARLVLDQMQPVWASGRVDTVLRWITWFERDGALDRYPAIALHGALIFALLGRPDQTERWAAVARRASPTQTLPDGHTMGSLQAYLRAILACDGVEAMRQDARFSFRELSPISPYRATMLYTEGISYLLDGDAERADPILANAFDDATRAGAFPLAALVLAERCFPAVNSHDWGRANALVDRAVSIVQDGHFEDYWTSALVYAWAARAAQRRGEIIQARRYAARTARLRPLLVYSIPVVPVQTLLELARVYIALGDPGGADAALRQAEDIIRERPNLGVLPGQATQLRANLDHIVEDRFGASSLTAAELRLLPLLSTHLSLNQIGERLHISRSTVKTQVKSIYRKLRVSSRGEAITRARDVGLHVA
jgi:LuxR family maltose regulon positive regulatory protein